LVKYKDALLQESEIIEMVETLFEKMNLVLSRLKYIIKIMSERFKKSKNDENLNGNNLMTWENKINPTSSIDSLLNFKVNKQVIERLKDVIRVKLDDLRTKRESDQDYIVALE
jgi:hypothetical protein